MLEGGILREREFSEELTTQFALSPSIIFVFCLLLLYLLVIVKFEEFGMIFLMYLRKSGRNSNISNGKKEPWDILEVDILCRIKVNEHVSKLKNVS